jgi:hypothetical protein
MEKPCVIVIEYETRKLMKRLARKDQTYDDLVIELIRSNQNINEGQN